MSLRNQGLVPFRKWMGAKVIQSVRRTPIHIKHDILKQLLYGRLGVVSPSAVRIELLGASGMPFADIVSTARTCYSSKGIVLPEDISQNESKDPASYLPLVQSLYQAGHHTTFQHSYLHFSMENISRHSIWSFLHSHPFYNSEQVSQRYVKVKKDQFFVPKGLSQTTYDILQSCYQWQIESYNQFAAKLSGLVEAEYLKRFKSRGGTKTAQKEIQKKSWEIARYLLPLGTTAYLHHTISFITLLRYQRLCETFDVPSEQRDIVEQMIAAVFKADPQIDKLIEDPLPLEETPEYKFFEKFGGHHDPISFNREFDAELGTQVSRLIDYQVNQEKTLARSIREIGGYPSHVDDEKLISFVMDSGQNPILGESLNLSTHSKLMRSLLHSHYVFQKKISHTADSQDQRHRMTPGSRPVVQRHFTKEPDYITPFLLKLDDELKLEYAQRMEKNWEFVNEGLSKGMSFEQASYMLPNALAIRFTESGDLLNLKHKMAMRLCYNAQEEIWQASLEEALQISEVHPMIGKYLLPPCTIRKAAAVRPICPEGPRFCGVPVWKIERENYQRTI